MSQPAGTAENAADPAVEVKSRQFCNHTDHVPGFSLEQNISYVNELKEANPNPTGGYTQHINQRGITYWPSLNGIDNQFLAGMIIAIGEVLSIRSAKHRRDGKPESANESQQYLKAVREFLQKRPEMIDNENEKASILHAIATAKASGIDLILPHGVLESVGAA